MPRISGVSSNPRRADQGTAVPPLPSGDYWIRPLTRAMTPRASCGNEPNRTRRFGETKPSQNRREFSAAENGLLPAEVSHCLTALGSETVRHLDAQNLGRGRAPA